MIKYLISLLLLATSLVAQPLSQSGDDVSLVAPGTGRLLLGTTGAKGIKLVTGQGGTALGWAIDSSGNLSTITGAETISPASLASGDGTAATPTYGFSADTGNGMYRSGADTLAWSINGSTKLQLNSSAIRPSTAGGITAGTASLPFAEVYGGNGTINTYVTYSAGESRGLVGTSSNHNLGLRANSSTKALIKTDGNVQLTTTSAGIILVSPDGTCSLCTVSNADAFTCASTTC